MNQAHSECIEIKISSRRFQIKLEGFTEEAKDEIMQTFDHQDIEIIELLKAHLSKIQEYSLLNQHLKSLIQKITQ